MNNARTSPHDDDNRLHSAGLLDGREWPAIWLSLTLAMLAYVALAVALGHIMPADGSNSAQKELLFNSGDAFLPEIVQAVRPEPLEKTRYLLGLFCIPTLPMAFYLLAHRLMPSRLLNDLNRPRVLATRDLFLIAVLLAWFWTLLRSSAIPNIELYLAFAFPLAASLLLWRSRLPSIPPALSWAVIGILAVLGFLSQLVGDNWYFHRDNLWHHIDIVLAVVNQVAHGKTVLVDTTSQYGLLYPYVVALSLAPCGVSMPAMTVFFAALTLAQAVFVFLAVSRLPGMTPAWKTAFVVTYAGLAAPMLGCALFNALNTLFFLGGRTSDLVPVYFQFVPIRTIWFAIFVWLTAPRGRPLKGFTIPLGYCLAGVSFLWNADSGLVILLAWTGMLVFGRLDRWRSDPVGTVRHGLTHIAAMVVTMVGALFAYGLFALLRSSHWPRYEELFRFQQIFYQAGFFMLPMPLWEFWQPIVALFAFTICWCLRQAACERTPAVASWKFFIAAYGLGMFSYYQGRSMTPFLPSTFLPAAILAFIWMREGFTVLAGRSFAEIRGSADLRLVAIKTFPLLVFCICGFLNLCRSLPAVIRYSFDTAGSMDARGMDPIWEALRPHVAGKAVAILADPNAFIHTKTGSWSSLPVASPTEVFLESQLEGIRRVIEDPEAIVVLQPQLKPYWVDHLDLTSFKETHRLLNGFVILKYDPVAAGKPRASPHREQAVDQ